MLALKYNTAHGCRQLSALQDTAIYPPPADRSPASPMGEGRKAGRGVTLWCTLQHQRQVTYVIKVEVDRVLSIIADGQVQGAVAVHIAQG